MALIKCSECGKEISDKAVVCVNCGNPISTKKKIKKKKKKDYEELTFQEKKKIKEIMRKKGLLISEGNALFQCIFGLIFLVIMYSAAANDNIFLMFIMIFVLLWLNLVLYGIAENKARKYYNENDVEIEENENGIDKV